MTSFLPSHLFVAGLHPDGVPVVLLHGSGGDDRDLLPLAAELAPGAPALSIRGTVAIDGGFAFFRRRPDRTIDEVDLDRRIPPLAEFIGSAGAHHGLAKLPIVIGFSNGAIMAAALLLRHPGLFAGAVLLRPLSPFLEDQPDRLEGVSVLIIDGEKDIRRSPGDGAQLAERFNRAGAAVTHRVVPVGHAVTEIDKQIARDWIAATG